MIGEAIGEAIFWVIILVIWGALAALVARREEKDNEAQSE